MTRACASHCNEFAKVTYHVASSFYGFALSAVNRELSEIINLALIWWQAKPSFHHFISDAFRLDTPCSKVHLCDTRVHAKDMLGLFLIIVGAAVAAMLSALSERFRGVPKVYEEVTPTRGRTLFAL